RSRCRWRATPRVGRARAVARPSDDVRWCGRRVATVHDVSERVIRDLPLFDAETYLRVPRRRVQCPRCGPRVERLAWLHRYARVTARLAESVVRLCQQLPIKHVAHSYGRGWGA